MGVEKLGYGGGIANRLIRVTLGPVCCIVVCHSPPSNSDLMCWFGRMKRTERPDFCTVIDPT
jgi:hypothetical protein